MDKTVEYYLDLPYTIELVPEPEGGWFVAVKELPGCMSQGDTPEEAIEMIQDAMRGWIEVSLEDGDSIPEPRSLDDYSGKFVVRVPRSLHRDLVETAEREGVSLNQYINVALGRGVGRQAAAPFASVAEPIWPGLGRSLKRVLASAGYGQEAGELDERLFADWVNRGLAQVESAVRLREYREALNYLDALAFGLRAGADQSPAVEALYRAILLLHQQINTIAQFCRERIDANERIIGMISQFVQTANRAQIVVQEERVAYSEASTASSMPRQYLEELVGQQAHRPKW